VFLGPNGSGKSTVFDIFAFLSECFTIGLRPAWDKRGRFRQLRTRGESGPIVIELKYREKEKSPLITYHLAINENTKGPYVAEEWLQWRRGNRGKPFRFLNFKKGEGEVVSGDMPDEKDTRIPEKLESADLLAVSTLGQFAKHPRVSALRRFITGWYLSYLTADHARSQPEAGTQERLSPTGDNLPNVIQYLKEQHPDRLEKILETLSKRIPRLEKVEASIMPDGRLLLQIKDAPFSEPILAKFASDGTLKMLAYLTVLYDPDPPQLVGVEEPENHLHPRLLGELAEECRSASANTQLMVTTHSPFFIDGLRQEEVWVLYRDEKGFTQAKRTADMKGVKEFIREGALLGQLWMEGSFDVGNPYD
jgi:predicted ATPase